ncbi:MAG: hypothetical protein WCS15_00025 [Prevotella sp.]|nr:hypothetical protein [Massilibacteroides sp.]
MFDEDEDSMEKISEHMAEEYGIDPGEVDMEDVILTLLQRVDELEVRVDKLDAMLGNNDNEQENV